MISKTTGVLLFALSTTEFSFAEAPTDAKWIHEQAVVAEAKRRVEQTAPYWLRDFSKDGDFKKKSLEMAGKIGTISEANNSPFCIAVFMDSPNAGKNASIFCIKQVTKNGYDSMCTPLQINLGTGKNLSSGRPIGAKCDDETATRMMRMSPANLLLESDYYSGGFNGDLGVYVYRDKFGTIKKWIEWHGEVNRPKPSKAPTHKKKNGNKAAEK